MTPQTAPRSRSLYADMLRVVAIGAVVNLHVSSGLAGMYGATRADWWWIGNVYDSISRWSVPVFLMISGMLILGHSQEMSIGAFLRKRFLRVFVPYIFWALAVYVPWKTFVLQEPFTWQKTISEFLRGSTYYHLWFIYTIMNTYLLAPVLRVVTKNAGEKTILYLLALWFANLTLSTLCEKFLNVTLGLSVELAKGFVGYFVLGYYLDRVEVPPRYRRAIYVLAAISVAITIWGTGYLSAAKGSLDDFFYSYLVPTTMVISTAVFLAFKQVDGAAVLAHPKSTAFITTLSAASFGVYFVHPIILWALDRGTLGVAVGITSFGNPAIAVPLTTVLTLCISTAIAWVIRLAPFGKTIVP